jgi:type IX secretion system PorP/SprF family membrane protein
MKRYLTILSVGMLGLSMSGRAQDLHFSQFYENSILRNPALTGIFSGEYKVGLDYRNQWSNISVPFNTVAFSAETRVLVNREIGDYISFGLAATYDKAGTIDFTSQQVYPSVSYNKALEDKHNTYLSVGLTGGYVTSNVDMSKMTFSSQYVNGNYSANNPTGETSPFKATHNYDIGAGVSLNGSLDLNGKYNYYLGASAFNINTPTQAFSGADASVKTPMKWQFGAGVHCALTDQFALTIHANYSQQQPYNEWIGGALITWRPIQPGVQSVFAFSFGAFYRYQDAIIPTIKLEYQNLAFGFSYDVTNSSLSSGPGAGAGATEITLYVKGKYNHRKDPRDPIMCPRFEGEADPFH